MNTYPGHFKNKKITVMGLGLLGRGAGDAEFLAEHGAELIITDLKGEVELAPSLGRLKKFSNITYRLGEHALEDFQNRDYILKAAGVPLDSAYIEEAKKNGIPIKMSASWFAELAHIPVVGITGTRGKTTVTMMLYDILKISGKRILLGGNIRGVSTLALLDEAAPDSMALMELDSWQLQGWGEASMSPNIAVFTTFYDDHLNYYKNDRARYLNDKAQIFLNQKDGDALVLGEQAKNAVLGAYTPPVTPVVAGVSLVEGWELKVPGEHNRYNAACAALAAKALGIEEEVCRRALANFKGAPGRLEFLREVKGVRFYNDTTATTPEATIAALQTLAHPSLITHDSQTILIFGGADKGLDMSALLPRAQKTKKVILLAGTGTEKIQKNFSDAPVYDSLKAAVADALASATAGDFVLFSPAFASFGMFKNEFDRGDAFNELVQAL